MGGEDKCYLPRCKNDKTTAIPGDIYTAGCLCAATELFTSSDPTDLLVVPAVALAGIAAGGPMPTCLTDGASKVDTCICGTDQVCKKGESCDATAAGLCDGEVSDPLLAAYKSFGLYANAMPANLTEASKFAI